MPILVLSSAPAGRDALRRAGVQGVLAKPTGHSRLRDEIKRILAAARQSGPDRPRRADTGGAPRHRPGDDRPIGGRIGSGRLAEIAAAATSRVAGRDATPRVLLAEDNEINQMVAVNVLEKCGYHVDLAQTGREAVEMSRRGRYQAIFMDCRLPELDGYSAASEIRRLEAADRHTPIIAITAHTMRGDREKCLAAGMDEYIAKPLRRETLELVLRRALPRADAETGIAVMPASRGVRGMGVDHSLLGELDDESVERIVALFVSSSRDRVAELARAVADDDAEAIRSLTHGLKGAAASVGAQPVCEACDSLAAAASQGSSERIRETQLALERALVHAESVLTAHDRRKALR